MIDSVKILIKGKVSTEKLILTDNFKVRRETAEVICESAFLENLRVNQYQNYVRILGSLPKYYKGNNVDSLTMKEIKDAMEKLSDDLRFNIDQADLYGIDIGHTFKTEKPINQYTALLLNTPPYKTHQFENGKKFILSDRNITFYNKVTDLKRSNDKLYPTYKNDNLLRIELRMPKHLKGQVGLSCIKCGILTDGQFLERLLQKFKNNYEKINKRKDFNKAEIPIQRGRELEHHLIAYSISKLGMEFIEDQINNSSMSVVEKSRNRRKYRNLTDNENYFSDSLLINEMNQKIKDLEWNNAAI